MNKYTSLKIVALLFGVALVCAPLATLCQDGTLTLGDIAPTPPEQPAIADTQGLKEASPALSSPEEATVQALARAVGDYPSPYAPIAGAVISALAAAYFAHKRQERVSLELVRNVQAMKILAEGQGTVREDLNYELKRSQDEAGVRGAVRSLIKKEEKERKKASRG